MKELSPEQVKDLLLNDFKEHYLEIVAQNLEYLGYKSLAALVRKSDLSPAKLDSLIKKEIDDILPSSLMTSVLAWAFDDVLTTRKSIEQKLSNPEICQSVKNVITPFSPRISPQNFAKRLYPPQEALLYAMLELEKVPVMTCLKGTLSSRVAVVSERLGFGKTLTACALLSHSRKVAPLSNPHVAKYNFPEIPQKLPTVTMDIVICNLKTAAQWEKNAKENTNLSVHKITSAKMLETFCGMAEREKFPDVLIVKDGCLKGKPVVESVKEILDGKLVTRVIVDDYDVLNLAADCVYPGALFYWLISTTRPSGDFVPCSRPSLSLFARQMVVLDNYVNIKCLGTFLTEEYQVPRYNVFYDRILSKEEASDILCDKCAKREEVYNMPVCDKCIDFMENIDWDFDYPNLADNTCTGCYLSFTQDGIMSMFRFDDSSACNRCNSKVLSTFRQDISKSISCFLNDNTLVESQTIPRSFRKLLQGTVDKPPKEGSQIKAIFLAEENKSSAWKIDNVSTVEITHRNISKFKDSDVQLGICKKLSGIDMEYVTHVIVSSVSEEQQVLQFIGRAQRLGRQQNLQILVLDWS